MIVLSFVFIFSITFLLVPDTLLLRRLQLQCIAVCTFLHFSEHLYASELHGRGTSVGSGEKIVSDLQVQQTAFSQARDRDESESDPNRDIELELRALDMEDSDQQEIKSQVPFLKGCFKVLR